MTELQNQPETENGKPKSKLRRTETRLEISDPQRADRVRRDPPFRMTLAEAATYIGISPRTLRDHVRCRRISQVKLGGRIVFRREQLDNDLAKLEQASA